MGRNITKGKRRPGANEKPSCHIQESKARFVTFQLVSLDTLQLHYSSVGQLMQLKFCFLILGIVKRLNKWIHKRHLNNTWHTKNAIYKIFKKLLWWQLSFQVIEMPEDIILLVEESRVKGVKNQYRHSMGDGIGWDHKWEAEPKSKVDWKGMESQPAQIKSKEVCKLWVGRDLCHFCSLLISPVCRRVPSTQLTLLSI